MSVKYCKDCGCIFDEEDANIEDCGFYTEVWGHQEYQVFDVLRCPDCNSDEIDDAEKCEECGDYFSPDELDEDGYCPYCHEDKGE